jgi:hypothetical protein
MPDTASIKQLKDAISQHLDTVGPRNWKLVRDQFPEIAPATFWRYVRQVKSGGPQFNPDHGGDITGGTEYPEVRVRSPIVPPDFYNPLAKIAEWERLLVDADKLRDQACDKSGKIVNWRMFDRSILVRKHLLLQQKEAINELLNLHEMQKFYNALIETISAASPEVIPKVMDALYGFQEKRQKGKRPDDKEAELH